YMEAPRGFYRHDAALYSQPAPEGTIGVTAKDFQPRRLQLVRSAGQEMVVPDPCKPPSPSDNMPYAHLYLGGCKRAAEHVFAAITFLERPPGLLGTSLLTAATSLLAVVTVAVAFQPLVLSGVGNSTDVAALLVAAPGAISVALVPKSFDSGLTFRPVHAFAGF